MSSIHPDAEAEADTGSESDPEPIDFSRVLADQLDRDSYGSITDLNPDVFHASSVGYTPRQMYVKKLGLDALDTDDLGAMRVGSMLHEFIEEAIANDAQTDLLVEQNVSLDVGDVTIRGRYDAYDADAGIVYDFKTRSNWYKFSPPSDRHLVQLLVYLHALDAPYGQLVYISKKDMEIRTWPEDGPFHRDDYVEHWNDTIEKVHRVRDAIVEQGVAMTADEIPFEQGDDWLSKQEQLAEWL